MKRLLAFAFVLTLIAINWQFSKAVFAFLTTTVAEPDRGEKLPPLPGIFATDNFQIARGGRRPSGLWLTCSEGPQIRLALNTRLPIEEEFARNGTRSGLQTQLMVLAENVRTYQTIKNAPHILVRGATWRRDDENDVLLTPPLSADEVGALSQAFLPSPPAVVRISAAETGTEMPGTADGRAITEFAKHCLAKK